MDSDATWIASDGDLCNQRMSRLDKIRVYRY